MSWDKKSQRRPAYRTVHNRLNSQRGKASEKLCIDYYRMINKVKADAWDECAARARGDMEAELAAANPYKKEVAQ